MNRFRDQFIDRGSQGNPRPSTGSTSSKFLTRVHADWLVIKPLLRQSQQDLKFDVLPVFSTLLSSCVKDFHEELHASMDFGKLLTIIVACLCCAHAANEQCIEGRYHKESPSAETDEYKVCTPWKSLTCCTPQFDNELDKNEARNLYNHSWHRCGNLSKECLRFWKRQV